MKQSEGQRTRFGSAQAPPRPVDLRVSVSRRLDPGTPCAVDFPVSATVSARRTH